MNERIKQLAEQAGFETDCGPLIGPSPYIKVGGLCVGVPLEKFAGLVIRQVMFEFVEESTHHPSPDVMKFVASVADRVKDKFGVE